MTSVISKRNSSQQGPVAQSSDILSQDDTSQARRGGALPFRNSSLHTCAHVRVSKKVDRQQMQGLYVYRLVARNF